MEKTNDDYFDVDHAMEWLEMHPYGYYNNEFDYGIDNEDEDEE